MAAAVLVGYATRYGTTREAAETIAAALCECGFKVDVQLAREVPSLDGYNAVVLGAPLFMFHWHKDVLQFLSRYQNPLIERPVAVFALGPTHDPHDEKEWNDSRDQFEKELSKFPWFTPVAVEVFGGKYNPVMLRFPLNLFAGKTPASDIRDLNAVRAWASSLAAKLEPAMS